MKTIDINALEWFDKTYGNSYFAGTITINFGMPDKKAFLMPFQYGYGSQYEYEALKTLQKENLIPDNINSLWQYCNDNNIILRSNIVKNCKQRELKHLSI
jgi:hypothetical protein